MRDFKIAVLAVMLCCVLGGNLTAADLDHEDYKLVDLGGIKVVIFEDTKSRDGHYALGWTLRPVDKKAPAVDWSKWNPDDRRSMDQYDTQGEPTQAAPYQDVDCVVDLQRQKILPLASEAPFCPHNTHGGFYASWGPEMEGHRCALVQINASFCTLKFWLVIIDKNGMRLVELTPALTKRVLQVTLDKRPEANPAAYEYGVMVGAGGKRAEISFHAQLADIPFEADTPHRWNSTSKIAGWITVRLPEGTIEKAWSGTPLDGPFVNDPALAKADRELNQIYSALLLKIKPAAREALKKEQREWIRARDVDSSAAESNARGNGDDPPAARDKSLLESTRARVAELKVRLGVATKN